MIAFARRGLLCSLLLIGVALLPSHASAAEPPNQADPCSKNGRNTCGTNGVGRYVNYKFGPRWFGDYRRAVSGESDPTFCIDLRFWYPGKSYKYEKRSTDGLKNRNGDKVSETKLRRMNVALWRYGRSNDPVQQGAMMLYVHKLMGDGASGEVDPSAGGAAIQNAYNRIVKFAERYDDPIQVTLSTGSDLGVGKETKLTVRVRTSSGVPLSGVSVGLSARGATGLPKSIVSDNDGTVSVSYTPADSSGLRVTATASGMPANAPTMYAPTSTSGKLGGASRSGQRLVSAATTDRSASLAQDIAAAKPVVTTEATPRSAAPGAQVSDKITIAGTPADWTSAVEVRLYGPFPTRDAIACTGTPLSTQTVTAKTGDTVSPPVTVNDLGWYGFQIVVPGSSSVEAVTTECVPDSETVNVQVQPTVITQVSSNQAAPGSQVTDSVKVSGLQGQTVTVQAALYGPYPALDAMICSDTPVWSGSFTANGDGTYVTEPATLTTPGYYTYRESIAESGVVKGVQTPCGELAETTIVKAAPAVRTEVSAAETAPGSALQDNVIVTGLGALRATVDVKLFGPFPEKDQIACDGTPAWSGTVTTNGDGTYQTEAFTVQTPGFYTYVETLAESNAYTGDAGVCGEASETTIVKAAPAVTTIASDAVVRPGSKIHDNLTVTGTAGQELKVRVDLFGPFRSRAAIRCSGTPKSTDTVTVKEDGTYKSESTTVQSAGFYTYRERIVGQTLVTASTAACGEEAETSLAQPLIQTGRTSPSGDAGAAAEDDAKKPAVDATGGVGPAPVSLKIKSLGISGPIDDVTINDNGEVGVPTNIDRAGWWKDGAAPSNKRGTTLIGGHIDSAVSGAGIFYSLRKAKRGQRVSVTLSTGKRVSYRITRVQLVRKDELPSWLFSRSGPRRLALVTCGGPFDSAKGHYRDNVIVTAVPG